MALFDSEALYNTDAWSSPSSDFSLRHEAAVLHAFHHRVFDWGKMLTLNNCFCVSAPSDATFVGAADGTGWDMDPYENYIRMKGMQREARRQNLEVGYVLVTTPDHIAAVVIAVLHVLLDIKQLSIEEKLRVPALQFVLTTDCAMAKFTLMEVVFDMNNKQIQSATTADLLAVLKWFQTIPSHDEPSAGRPPYVPSLGGTPQDLYLNALRGAMAYKTGQPHSGSSFEMPPPVSFTGDTRGPVTKV